MSVDVTDTKLSKGEWSRDRHYFVGSTTKEEKQGEVPKLTAEHRKCWKPNSCVYVKTDSV